MHVAHYSKSLPSIVLQLSARECICILGYILAHCSREVGHLAFEFMLPLPDGNVSNRAWARSSRQDFQLLLVICLKNRYGPQNTQTMKASDSNMTCPSLNKATCKEQTFEALRTSCFLLDFTILTQMMADEFNFLWTEIQNYIAEADADLIPVPGQLELYGRCRYGVLLSPCFGALYLLQI